MNQKKQRIGLIYGGRGREREVSVCGRNHILPLIEADDREIIQIFIDKDGRWLTEKGEVCPYRGGFISPENGDFIAVDCAIPLLHGDFGEDGRVQGALEVASIPYVGCDVSGAAVCRDKVFVKTIAKHIGIPTLPYLLVLKNEGIDYAIRQAEESFSYPLFVKPTSLGSSVGVCAAESHRELVSALTVAFTLSERAMIEPYLTDKRELECGYLGVKGKEIFTNPGEILCEGLYGYEEKYSSDRVALAIRADLGESHSHAIRDYSRRLVRALGVRDLCRVDFFLSDDRIYLNEINTMPGFTDGSLYARMIEAYGISEGGLFSLLIDNCVCRR